MKVLLFGGSGQLGTEIRTRWEGDDVSAPSHADVDILDSAAVAQAVEFIRPDVVVNCAAFHNVDVCEQQPGAAFSANAIAVDAMAQACYERDIVFVTVSTDYVFDGTKQSPYFEEDVPRPLSVYAVSKLAGEFLVLRRDAKAFVVRTCGVYGVAASKSKGTFIDRVIKQARSGEPIRAVNDVVASPTFAGHLADAIRALIPSERYGLYHACNVGAVTWYEFAKTAIERAGVSGVVEPIAASTWKAIAQRPSYSALGNRKLDAMGIAMPDWTTGITEYLRDRRAMED